jgi:hypothetical protein
MQIGGKSIEKLAFEYGVGKNKSRRHDSMLIYLGMGNLTPLNKICVVLLAME